MVSAPFLARALAEVALGPAQMLQFSSPTAESSSPGWLQPGEYARQLFDRHWQIFALHKSTTKWHLPTSAESRATSHEIGLRVFSSAYLEFKQGRHMPRSPLSRESKVSIRKKISLKRSNSKAARDHSEGCP